MCNCGVFFNDVVVSFESFFIGAAGAPGWRSLSPIERSDNARGFNPDQSGYFTRNRLTGLSLKRNSFFHCLSSFVAFILVRLVGDKNGRNSRIRKLLVYKHGTPHPSLSSLLSLILVFSTFDIVIRHLMKLHFSLHFHTGNNNRLRIENLM